MAADSPDPRALPRGRPDRLASVRRGLLHTLPGRLLVVGGIIKLATWLLRVVAGIEIPLLDAAGSIGSVGVIVGLGYFAWKLIVRAKRRLLWRVRRKLILSYIFVGVVPVLLVVAFFVLAGLLLFLNVASYLVASSIRTVTDDAHHVAQQTAAEIAPVDEQRLREIVARQGNRLAQRYPGASIAVVPTLPEPCGTPASPLGRRTNQLTELSKRAADLGREFERLSDLGAPASAMLQDWIRATAGEILKLSDDMTALGLAMGQEFRRAVDLARSATPFASFGRWSHLAAPHVLPGWVPCTGFAKPIAVAPPAASGGQQAAEGIGLVVRAAELPAIEKPRFAVIVDIPLDAEMKSHIRDETSVKIGRIDPTSRDEGGQAIDVAPQSGSLFTGLTDDTRKRRLRWLALLDYVHWSNGATDTAAVGTEVNLADIYNRVSAEQAHVGRYTWGSIFLIGLAFLALLFVIIEVVALIMGLVLAKSITGSVHQLFTGTERVRQGDFSHKIRISTRDQMGELAESFNSMTGSIEELLRQAEEKKRLEEELRIARAIQMSLLPRGQLSIPGLSITALCVPAREVGGDYYDLLPLDDGRLGVLIADVSGKGTSAALYMAELKGLMLSLCRIYTSPRRLLIEANRIIANNLDSRSFITMTYAVIDLRAGTMTYARAGHTPLIRRRDDGGTPTVAVLAPDGLVVGLQMQDGAALFERLLKEETLLLRQGDLFMFYTDGITEAMNAASDCFGEGRLGEILVEHGDLPSEELRERILREIDAFVAGAPQHDDMTMILVKVEALAAAVDSQPVLAQRAVQAE
jgi:serine phosphatase RsbU (regulator of sigma subunit)